MEEEWRSIKGFPLYQVSNYGRVKSICHHGGPTKTKRIIPLILKTPLDSRGYPQVDLKNETTRRNHFKVHRLVAQSFLGIPPKELEINHIDLDKSNNHASNLEYVTHRQNLHHAMKRLRCAKRLTFSDVINIRKKLSQGESLSSIATFFLVSKQNISAIKRNKTWSWL